MKKMALLLFFLSLTCLVFSQEKQLEYSGEVTVAQTSAKQLHDRCMDWFSRNFNHPNKVYIESTEQIIIALPHLIYYPNFIRGSAPLKGTIPYTFEVDVSDGKFTYVINHFVHQADPVEFVQPISLGLITTDPKAPDISRNLAYAQLAWNDIKFQIKEQIKMLIENLKEEMAKAAEITPDE